MRLLHAGPGHGGARPARPRSEPDDLAVREAISGNLCRCTGYGRILGAVRGPSWTVADRRGRRRDVVTRDTRPARRAGRRRQRRAARRDRPRCAASSRSPSTSGPTACCGARRCARRTRRRASARSTSAPRSRSPGVHAVLTADDVPGTNRYGLEHRDQPVFAGDVVRYAGEPVAVVAADHPDTARRAAAAIVVDYEVLDPLIDPEAAIDAPPLHPDGNVFRDLVIRRGDPAARGPVVVEGTYEIGMQDQAFMGPEAGLAIPDDDGGVDLFVSTQWLHNDRDQVAECLGLPPEQVRLTLGGVGGAFGAREDVSLHIHSCLLALRTGRPVKMVYSREESFLGHVHRHPARIWMRHHAIATARSSASRRASCSTAAPTASSSVPVTANAACFAAGPYRRAERAHRRIGGAHQQPAVRRDARVRCGAVVLRARGADGPARRRVRRRPGRAAAAQRAAPGDCSTGQRVTGAVPVAEVIRACAAASAARPRPVARARCRCRVAPVARDAVTCGVASASRSASRTSCTPRASTTTRRLGCRLDDGVVTITCAAAEVGQGFVTLVQQIAREVLGVDEVIVAPADTSTSARPAPRRPAGRR